MNIKQEYKDKVLEMTYRFYDLGLSTSRDSGDLSILDPETGLIYIDPRPAKDFKIIPNWRCITVDDIVVVDMEGNIVDGGKTGTRKPTVEMPMHLAIYRARPDCRAVIHSHALYSSVFASMGLDIPACLVETLLNAKGDIKCAEYGRVSSAELGENIVRALAPDRKAAILRQHGAVYIGTDIEDAMVVAEYVERAAQITLLTWATGNKTLTVPRKNEDLFDSSIMDILDEI